VAYSCSYPAAEFVIERAPRGEYLLGLLRSQGAVFQQNERHRRRFGDRGDIVEDHLPDPVETGALGSSPLLGGPRRLKRADVHVVEQVPLVRDIVVQRRLGDPELLRQVAQRRPVIAAAVEPAGCSLIEHLFPQFPLRPASRNAAGPGRLVRKIAGLRRLRCSAAVRRLSRLAAFGGIHPAGQQSPRFVALLPGTGNPFARDRVRATRKRNDGIGAQRQPLFLSSESVLEPPELSAGRRDLDVEATAVEQAHGFRGGSGAANDGVGQGHLASSAGHVEINAPDYAPAESRGQYRPGRVPRACRARQRALQRSRSGSPVRASSHPRTRARNATAACQSSPSAVSGSPMITSRRARRGNRSSPGSIVRVPRIATGTMGTRWAAALTKAPIRNGSSPGSRRKVP